LRALLGINSVQAHIDIGEPLLFSTHYTFTDNFVRGGSMEHLNRITQQPEVMGGKACIRGTRVTVGMLVGAIAAGHALEELLADYPYLQREDILQALQYAAWRSEEREVVLAEA
jgi:uncharacterized protein (DUF433 family)